MKKLIEKFAMWLLFSIGYDAIDLFVLEKQNRLTSEDFSNDEIPFEELKNDHTTD